MKINTDYMTKEEREWIINLKKRNHQPLYEIGRQCEVNDKSYWSRILSGKKPVPPHVRTALIKLFQKEQIR